MNRNVIIGGVVAIALAVGGWWYLNQSSAPATSETAQLPTLQENVNTGTQTTSNSAPKQPAQQQPTSQTNNTSNTAPASSSGALFSHPSDEYTFAYDATKLEARATTASEFPSGTGLLPSSAVFSGGGYGQEVEILTYRGSIDAAQEAFIGAYRQYYSPQVLATESVTINGNQARVVTYKVGPSYPEATVYLIAYRPNEPRTIVATGDYDVVATLKSR